MINVFENLVNMYISVISDGFFTIKYNFDYVYTSSLYIPTSRDNLHCNQPIFRTRVPTIGAKNATVRKSPSDNRSYSPYTDKHSNQTKVPDMLRLLASQVAVGDKQACQYNAARGVAFVRNTLHHQQ